MELALRSLCCIFSTFFLTYFVEHFKTEIEPFLNENKELADQLLHIETDERLTERVREIMSDELMELLMSCHVSRFSLKLYHEKFKYINMWVNHAGKEGLL